MAEIELDAKPTQAEHFRTDAVVTASAAHFVHDTYSSFLAPLLPLLIENLTLTKTAAAMLAVFYQGPSLIQPLIGRIGDRVNLKILVILAPVTAAVTMTMLGIAPTYAVLALLLIVAGLNSAGLHSIGPVIVGMVSGQKLGRGMSFWMVGGELARTIGPLIVVSAVTLLTPRGLPWLVFGGAAASLLLAARLREMPDYRPPAGTQLAVGEALRRLRPIMLPVGAVVAFRSMLFAGIATFLPTYLTETGESLMMAGTMFAVMQAAGVAGAMFGGVVSDRLGRRRVLLVMTLAAPPAMLLLLNVRGWLLFPALLLVGLTMLSTTPAIMALVQERARDMRALANGVYMAFNFVIASVSALAIGRLGDTLGLHAALTIAALVMLAGAPFVLLLPRGNGKNVG